MCWCCCSTARPDPCGRAGQDADRHADATTVPGVVVVRVESGLFFANADHVRQAIRRLAGDGIRAVVLAAQSVPFIDVTAAQMLAELRASLAEGGVMLLLAREIGQVRDVLRRTEGDDAPDAVLFGNVDEAVAAAGRSPGERDGQQP